MIHQHETLDKQLRALHRELRELSRRQQHPPVHELPQPIQRGWQRLFVLTAEARARPDAATLGDILAALNVVRYFWRRDFQPSRRALRLTRRTLSTEQPLRAVSPEEWTRNKYPEAWRKYFRLEIVPRDVVFQTREENSRYRTLYPRIRKQRGEHVLAWSFGRPHLFALRVERHWLTHVREIEPAVMERIAEIKTWMTQHAGRPRFLRLKGKSGHWSNAEKRARLRRQLAEREIRLCCEQLRSFSAPDAAGAAPLSRSAWRRRGAGCPAQRNETLARRGGHVSSAVRRSRRAKILKWMMPATTSTPRW